MRLWVRNLTWGPVFFRYAKLFGSGLRQTALHRASLLASLLGGGEGARARARGGAFCAPWPTAPTPSWAAWAEERGSGLQVWELPLPPQTNLGRAGFLNEIQKHVERLLLPSHQRN